MWKLTATRVLKGGYQTHVSVWRFETKLTAEIFAEMAGANWESYVIEPN
jgi:hypothetical protein